MRLLWYNKFMNNTTYNYYSPKQGRFPVFISEIINISDPVLVFDHIMEEIEITKYLKTVAYRVGRKGYNSINMLKTILFGFMDKGYISLRELEDECKVNIRYMYLMDYETPTYKTFGNFINDNLIDSAEEIFNDIMKCIIDKDNVDLNHLYIDGSKFKANANKYSWVWKKSTEKSRYRLFNKITALFEKMNKELKYEGVKIQTNTEYTPEYLDEILSRYKMVSNIDESKFVYGRGYRKSVTQKFYEKLCEYRDKLKEYVVKLATCGDDRNSYSKTDNSATLYNVQIGVADEYIAVVDVNH